MLPGTLRVAPPATGHATPSLRWNPGDIVSLPNGKPGKDFEKFMKAPRFVDRRV